MTVYLVNVGLILLEAGLFLGGIVDKEKGKKVFCFLASLQWILISGLRHLSIGADTYSYKIFRFNKTLNLSWDQVLGQFTDKYIGGNATIKDPSYTIIEKVFQIFSDDYQLFLVFIAIIFFGTMGILIYKHSRDPLISFILFSSLFFSFFAVTGHRQTIATAVAVFGGFFLIKKNKAIPFILLVLFASTIHGSAICFLPFYWFSKIRINKISLTVYWVAIALSFIFRYELLALLQSVVGYEQYEDFEGAGAGTFMLLLFILAIAVTVFHKAILSVDGENSRRFINALMIACFFSSLLLINQSFMRVVQYYSLFLMLLMPAVEEIFIRDWDKRAFKIVCITVLILLLVKVRPVYMFFWQ